MLVYIARQRAQLFVICLRVFDGGKPNNKSFLSFSRNEELEEIATTDLKYLLLPALLGALTMKQVNLSKRLEQVQMARVYFVDFLKRCKDYNISKFELPKSSETSDDTSEEDASRPPRPLQQADLITMATQRQAKIERFVLPV